MICLIEHILKCEYNGRVVKYKCVYFPLILTKCYISFDWSRVLQTQNLAEILVSAEIPFVNLNLSRISAETKILDLSKISAEIWLRLETFRESGPWSLEQGQRSKQDHTMMLHIYNPQPM